MSGKLRIEDGVVVGTSGNKYENPNPIAQYLLRGFDQAISDLAKQVNARTVFEVGCGEGHVTRLLVDSTSATIIATDLSPTMVREAERNVRSDRVKFLAADIEKVQTEGRADLVVCCEVLEHLPDPHRGLRALWTLGAAWYLLSVPREPLFRAMNFARGAYLKDFGNSPGHLQHWSKNSFLRFIGEAFETVTVRSPIPWTVILCKRRPAN